MPLNLKKYRHHLNDFDMSESQKTEFIKAIALIAESLADKAFDLNSIHHINAPKQQQNCAPSSQMVKSIEIETLIDKNANDNEAFSSLKKANGKRQQ
jgi:hypothetical protein